MQVTNNTYEVFNTLIWYEDFHISYILSDLKANEEGWFFMLYDNFEQKWIKEYAVKNAVHKYIYNDIAESDDLNRSLSKRKQHLTRGCEKRNYC